MGLKKTMAGPSGAANQLIIATKVSSSAYPAQIADKKALGFFGHVTWQASGWHEGVAGDSDLKAKQAS